METIYDRTKLVFKDDFQRIRQSKILLIGVGGVGGYIFEMLCRIGVGQITVVDGDTFSFSNLNRQVLSTISVIGKSKVEVAKDRAKEINTDTIVTPIFARLNENNMGEIVDSGYDYVIDAIDDTMAKVHLMRFCKEKNIPLLSSMGTGNRKGIPHYEVVDISKTSYDRLARKLRTELKKYCIHKGVNVCYTKSPLDNNEKLGSVVYHPLMCAGTMVSFVINELTK